MFAATAAEEDADAEAFLVGSHGNIFSEKCVGLKGSRWGSFQETDRRRSNPAGDQAINIFFERNFWRVISSIPVRVTQEDTLSPQIEILKGTLDLMVLQTLAGLGSVHGYGIARRIEQVSGDTILLNQGTIYASLVRLQQRGLIRSEWGVSDNNRKAKFYSLTKRGTRELAAAAQNWEQMSEVMARFFAGQKGLAPEGSL